MLLHEFLYKIRKDHQLTQKNLADIMKCSVSYYKTIERGEHCPKYIRLILIAQHFNLPPNVFYPFYIECKNTTKTKS